MSTDDVVTAAQRCPDCTPDDPAARVRYRCPEHELGNALGHDPSDREMYALEVLINAWDWDLDDMPLACRLVATLRAEGLL